MLTALETKSADEVVIQGFEYTQDEICAMQRAIISLFDKWNVSDVDAALILGGIATRTFRRWKDGDYGRVNRDLADRMSNLLGIHKALRVIFSDVARCYEWVQAKNDAFGGKSALSILKQGGMEDIVRIRRYLDAARGW